MTATTRNLAVAGNCFAAVLFATACGSSATTAGSSGGVGGPSASSTSVSPSASAPSTSSPVTAAATVPRPTTAPSGPASAGDETCTAADLTVVTWKAVPGSSGAGSTSSDIAYQNTSSRVCAVSGYPNITLYDAGGTLPTDVTDIPGPAQPLMITPGSWFHAELRYSSDIPGPGEPVSGPCEPAATYALTRVNAGTAYEHVTLDSPTPVCEKGMLQVKAFEHGASSPTGG